ncbi:prostaglandin F synthase 2-like [Lucilia sericata]|uniref:prostaglandin F synthase 2-like n=1 Tax=Lucilia sericata TaxID=13632 RepID=UPI0018A86F7E|nr:prostaglandin F synthase 2-like [Lucilia sericata]
MASNSKNPSESPQKERKSLEEVEEKSYTAPEVPKIKLNNDKEIPVIGLGTSKLQAKCKELVGDALKLGYRHIDCAEVDGNEKEVGEAIREYIKKGLITREEIFVTSKLWNNHHAPQLVRKACEASLKKLGLSYLDCYIMHSPMAFREGDIYQPKDENDKLIYSEVDFLQTWRAMEKLVQNGLVKTLGLANFNIRQLNVLLEKAHIKPAVLHVECHPYLNQQILMDFCAANDIVVVAQHCLGSPSNIYRLHNKIPLTHNEKILEIAKKTKHTPAQVLIRYQIQRGNIVIATAVKRLFMRENILSVGFKLGSQAMADIDELDTGTRVYAFEDCKGHPLHPFEKDLY